MVVSLFIAGLAFEAVVLMIWGEQAKFPRCVVESDFGLRINLPGAHYRHKSSEVNVSFDINEQGMRANASYPHEKPAGRKRILSLGDSFTIGYEVAYEQCFSSVLEAELGRQGYDVEVLNAGVSGYSTAEECLYLERELFRYDPDVVLVSFYANDLVDNVRTGLFDLHNGELVQTADRYVPLGELGNLLNTNWFLIRLSERSNAFAVLKESVTTALKGRMVEQNLRNLDMREADDRGGAAHQGRDAPGFQSQLAAAIFERIFTVCRQRSVPFVIQSIPAYRENPKRLIDMFPKDGFDVAREGVYFMSAQDLLEPHLEDTLIYHMRSHFHWTPFAHEKVGKALARLVDERGLLGEQSEPR